MPRVAVGKKRKTVIDVLRENWFGLCCDAAVLSNAALLGIETERGPGVSYTLARILVCVAYLVEVATKCALQGPSSLLNVAAIAELAIICAVCTCVLVLGGQPEWMWRLSIFRCLRLARVGLFAEQYLPMKDLWLILVGYRNAMVSVGWYTFLVLVIVFSVAGSSMGLVFSTRSGREVQKVPAPDFLPGVFHIEYEWLPEDASAQEDCAEGTFPVISDVMCSHMRASTSNIANYGPSTNPAIPQGCTVKGVEVDTLASYFNEAVNISAPGDQRKPGDHRRVCARVFQWMDGNICSDTFEKVTAVQCQVLARRFGTSSNPLAKVASIPTRSPSGHCVATPEGLFSFPQNLPAAGRQWCRLRSYTLGEPRSQCPRDSRALSQDECLGLNAVFGQQPGSPKNEVEPNWRSFPRGDAPSGCSVRLPTEFQFNPNGMSNSIGRQDLRPICSRRFLEEVPVCNSMAEDCLDLHGYFGTLGRSMLTVLQLVTLDGWTSVVRPLARRDPLAAVFVTFVVIVCAYGLVSVLVGMMVEKMLRLARSHGMHASQKGVTEDKNTIATLGAFLQATLTLEDRSALKMRDLRDAVCTPAVKRAFDGLDLPLQVPDELWNHIDRSGRKTDEMSVDEFASGLLSLVKPSTPTDVCALTARLGGSVTYVTRMGRRSSKLRADLGSLRALLINSYVALGQMADPGADGGQVAEVGLRLDGAITNSAPPLPPRYTR